jgi:hypothetical protein
VLWLTRNPIRISVLSDRRESKDLSSPVSLLALSFRSLHKECFTTLLQSTASALFLKTAGCVPTIPILELAGGMLDPAAAPARRKGTNY